MDPVETLSAAEKNLAKEKCFAELNSWCLHSLRTYSQRSLIYFSVLVAYKIFQYESLAESLF